jgi:ubiquitin-protein ligase
MTTLVDENINTIVSLLSKLNNKKNINLLKYNIANYDRIMHFEIDTYPVKIITDFDKKCYAECSIESIKSIYNIFNLIMIFKDKTPKNILEELSKLVSSWNGKAILTQEDAFVSLSLEKKKPIFDPFHITHIIDEYCKYIIDFKQLGTHFDKTLEMNKEKIINEKIPKELLLSPNQIKQLIINEIKKVNRNKSYEHYIVPDEINPYSLCIRLKYNKESIIQKKFKKIDCEYMEIKFILDPKMYPYMPPKLEYVKPRIKPQLLISLLNLDILNITNWNYTITLDYIIPKLASEIELKGVDYIVEEESKYMDELLEYSLIKLAIHTKETLENSFKINIDVPKIKNSIETNSKYWKSGTGYGNDELQIWDIKSYIEEQEVLNDELLVIISSINKMITMDNYMIVLNSVLLTYIIKQIKGISMLELDKNKKLYSTMFNSLAHMIDKPMNQSTLNMISMGTRNILEEIGLIFKNSNTLLEDEEMLQIYCVADWYSSKYIEPIKEIIISTDIKEQYCMIMKKLQYGAYILPSEHRFAMNKNEKSNQKAILRILSELSSFKTGLPLNWESTIWTRVPKDNVNLFSFMISGPKDTPYENGLFEFHAYLPPDYPATVPKVLLHTTGNNTVRFNPNLYDSGKVCLSLLGTWAGQAGESWNPKASTFLQVMISIQSLILVEQPYFNEPGWEREMHTPKGKLNSDNYNEEKQPHTINLGMINMIKNPPNGFEEVVYNHFRMKRDEIINRTLIWEQNAKKNGNIIKNYRNELILLLKDL